MSRKDYQAIAEQLARGAVLAALSEVQLGIVVEQVALYLAEDNPRFSRQRFEHAIDKSYRACAG